jgi:hypothetical protein
LFHTSGRRAVIAQVRPCGLIARNIFPYFKVCLVAQKPPDGSRALSRFRPARRSVWRSPDVTPSLERCSLRIDWAKPFEQRPLGVLLAFGEQVVQPALD